MDIQLQVQASRDCARRTRELAERLNRLARNLGSCAAELPGVWSSPDTAVAADAIGNAQRELRRQANGLLQAAEGMERSISLYVQQAESSR